MKFGIVGYGSIGKRHIRNLVSLGYNNISLFRTISSGNEYSFNEFTNFDEFLKSDLDGVIIANPTNLHAEYLYEILDQNLNVLVEKPLISTIKQYRSVRNYLKSYDGVGMTAYNMRFHPCILELKKIFKKKILGQIYSARFFVGQFLPDWRPDTDYSQSYSAQKKMGGGVLFDLVHEIDLACFLIGEPQGEISSRIGNLSKLNIDTEDMAEILYNTIEDRFISIHMDYLSREYRRDVEIVGEKATITANLYSNELRIAFGNSKIETKNFPNFSKNKMYLSLMSKFIDCIQNNKPSSISLKEGLISNRIAINIRSKFYNDK